MSIDDRERAAKDPIFDPFATVNSRDPYPRYKTLRDEHPLYHVEARDIWVVSRYEDVRDVSRDWRTWHSSPSVDLDDTSDIVGPGSFVDMEPPGHDVFRKIVQKHFTPKTVNTEHAPVIASVLDKLFAELGDADEVDLATQLAFPLPVALLCRLMGFPDEDWEPLARHFRDLVAREPGSSKAPPAAHEAATALDEYLAAAVEERKAAPGDDVLSDILAQKEEGVMGDEEARGLCFLLFAAGTTTTSALLSNSIEILARHPQERRKLVERPELIVNGIEEVLRYEAAVQYLGRESTTETELHGISVPAGSRFCILHASANRDDRRYPDPDVFNVEREIPRHMGFGEGIHFCLGAPLARLETRLALERLLPAFPAYELAGEGQRSTEHTTRGWYRLPVALNR
jgi:cytochrome P450